MENNYDKLTTFFGDDDNHNLTKEQLAKEEYEYTKEEDSFGGDLQINIFCIIFYFYVAVFNERNGKHHRYFLYHIPQIIPEELIILLW